jgi:polysaccharide pyruvyl transferase WcaK-like protein
VSVGASGKSRFDLPSLATAVDALATERGVPVTIVELAEEDAEVCARLRGLLTAPTSTHRFADDVHDTMTVLAAADLVVSERLHGAVAGFALRRPTVSLSYGSKCEDFWRSVVDHGDAVPVGAGADQVLRAARTALDPAEQARRDARVDEHCRSLRAVVEHVDAWLAGTVSTADLRSTADRS